METSEGIHIQLGRLHESVWQLPAFVLALRSSSETSPELQRAAGEVLAGFELISTLSTPAGAPAITIGRRAPQP